MLTSHQLAVGEQTLAAKSIKPGIAQQLGVSEHMILEAENYGELVLRSLSEDFNAHVRSLGIEDLPSQSRLFASE